MIADALSAAQFATLRVAAGRLAGPSPMCPPWYRRELHNPWARAAALHDPWAILDLCIALAPTVRDHGGIGGDLILFDSAFLPDPTDENAGSVTDAPWFPVDPLAGATLVCGVDGASIAFDDAAPMPLDDGSTACVPLDRRYRLDGLCFVARYFAATSRYCRDPGDPRYRALTERLPLVNYATMPLWLALGEDRAGNDFVTGFNPRAAYWSAPFDPSTL